MIALILRLFLTFLAYKNLTTALLSSVGKHTKDFSYFQLLFEKILPAKYFGVLLIIFVFSEVFTISQGYCSQRFVC